MAIKLAPVEESENEDDPDEMSAESVIEATAPEDVFDNLDQHRLKQTFKRLKSETILATVGCRKPRDHEWFTVHPTYQHECTLFREREGISDEWFFLANGEVASALEELSPKGLKDACVFWWINRKGDTFIHPVQLADAEGRQNDYHASMYEMLSEHGRNGWCRIESVEGGYNPTMAQEDEGGEAPKPKWPKTRHFGEVLRIAFKKRGRYVEDENHGLFTRLRKVVQS
jgi:hypothetical protein